MADVVRLQIKDMIATMLEDITLANNYHFDIGSIYKEDVDANTIKEFPAVNVLIGAEEYLNPTKSEGGRLAKTLNVVLDCYIREKEDKETAISNFIADLELLFFNDQLVGGTFPYSLRGKALISIPIRTTPFDSMVDKHVCGVEFEFMVKYRQSRRDPTVLYN